MFGVLCCALLLILFVSVVTDQLVLSLGVSSMLLGFVLAVVLSYAFQVSFVRTIIVATLAVFIVLGLTQKIIFTQLSQQVVYDVTAVQTAFS